MKIRASWMSGLLLVVLATSAQGQRLRLRGNGEVEYRGYASSATLREQSRHSGSIAAQAELSLSWGRGKHLLTVAPFLRVDAVDSRRTHFDIRTLSYERAWRSLELRVGIRRVFWGVAESRHLIDVINQTDLVENLDGEDKLGQGMLNLAWLGGFGTLDLYLLTGFRQRTFPGPEGRPRTPLVVEPDLAVFHDNGLSRHLGWAARWSHYFGGWDVGIAHFNGMSRDPFMVPVDGGQGVPVFQPNYHRIHQTSLDAQWTTGGWLWKFEGLTRTGEPGGRAWAMVAGFEYTLYQLFGSDADLGLLAEVLLDTRAFEPFQDDVFAGARLALNDVPGTTLLAGAIVDRKTGATLWNVEAERRLFGDWTAEVELRAFAWAGERDPLYGNRQDDHLTVRLLRWF